MPRTSISHPLKIDALPLAAGQLGLTFCPGKQGDSVFGEPWARDLEADLQVLRDWGAGLVVSAMESHEFELLRVSQLPQRVAAHGMAWAQLPIRDVDIPAAPFDAVWSPVRDDILARLDAGGRVVLHCRGGLGRTGLVAALLLIETGVAAEQAMKLVRSVRPGTIETRAQEAFVRAYRRRG